jgi:hypothetical protein
MIGPLKRMTSSLIAELLDFFRASRNEAPRYVMGFLKNWNFCKDNSPVNEGGSAHVQTPEPVARDFGYRQSRFTLFNIGNTLMCVNGHSARKVPDKIRLSHFSPELRVTVMDYDYADRR